jgi:hypothetical protein
MEFGMGGYRLFKKDITGIFSSNIKVYVENYFNRYLNFLKIKYNESKIIKIKIEDLIIQGMVNPELAKFIGKSKLIYTNSLIFIDNSKYIKENNIGNFELTDFARLTTDECGPKFNIKINNEFKR